MESRAQSFNQFFDLIDDGQCTSNTTVGATCQTFQSTCSGGWVPANGTPELLPVTGWACAAACTQGTAYCDPEPRMSILMVGSGTDGQGHPIGEGVYKKFYFQSGLTYEICAFYSISGTGGTIGLINFAMANGLTPYIFSGPLCQSAPPLTNAKIVGVANSNIAGGYTSFTFTPTTNYTQLLIYATAPSGGSYTGILTGLFVQIIPSCTTPSIISVSNGGNASVNITFTAIPGVAGYVLHFLDPTTGNVLYSTSSNGFAGHPIYNATTGTTYPTTYSNNVGLIPAGTYKVTVQAINSSCPGGLGSPSAPSNTITITD